jgi:C-terminal processing protease CtpA/Prc
MCLKTALLKKQGIKIFDKIISIDGNNVTGADIQYSDVRNYLKQKPGTKVKLEIFRGGKQMIIEVVIGEVEIKTVSAQYIK